MKTYFKVIIVLMLLVTVSLVLVLKMSHSGGNSGSTSSTDTPSQGEGNSANSGDVGAVTKVKFLELGSVNCVPCKMMVPVMEEIEKEYGDQVEIIFYDVKTEEGSRYAQQYHIQVIPTQVFLDKDGKEYFRHTGYFPKDDLVEVLKMQGVE